MVQHGACPRGSSSLLEDALVVLMPAHPKEVTFDVGVAENAVRINALDQPDEVVEAWVHLAQVVGPQGVGLRPMRLAAVAEHDLLKVREELPVGYVETIRPAGVRV